MIFALLQRSGPEPAISLKCTYIPFWYYREYVESRVEFFFFYKLKELRNSVVSRFFGGLPLLILTQFRIPLVLDASEFRGQIKEHPTIYHPVNHCNYFFPKKFDWRLYFCVTAGIFFFETSLLQRLAFKSFLTRCYGTERRNDLGRIIRIILMLATGIY